MTGLRYPILRAPIQLGEESADDAILLPAFDGGVCENPKEAVPARGGFDAYYPGPASCQVLAYYDRTAGLYLAAQDAEGNPKRFTLSADVGLVFSFQHLFPTLPGEDVALEYPVVVGAFVGDWQDAAAIYREWSLRQAWCGKPLRQKTPEWLARGALVTDFDPRHFPRDRLQSHLGRFRELYGAPLIANSRGWERWGMWTGQEYLPPLPSEQHFTDAGRIIREADGRGMVMLSGYRWTIEKRQPDGSLYSSQERFDREVAPYAVCDAQGAPIIHTSDKPDDWRGQKWAMLCRATDFATETIVDTAEYCVRHGYPVIHFDQEVSGSYLSGVCESRAHGHPPGRGRYVHEGLVGLYRRMWERCAPADPDFVLSMEEPNELYLPYLNLCQCRPFGLTTEWPAVAPMTRTVPLFSFLYHDYLIQWAAFYPWKSGGHPEVSAAKGFAAGLMPGLHPYDYTLPAEGTTGYSEFFRRCMDLYLGPAREYLVFGRMLKAPPLDVPPRTLSLGEDRGETTVPAVWHGLWQLEDGRLGLVLINPGTQALRVTVDLSALTPEGAAVRLVSPDGEAHGMEAAGPVDLKAASAALVEITPKGH